MTRFTVRLTPRAGRDSIDGWAGDVLRVRVAAAPTEGQANDALVRLIAKTLRIAPSHVVIVAGTQSRTKVLAVEGVVADDLRAALGD